MNDREFVQQVWDLISSVLADEGFALGGGLAMRAYGLIDRDTQDIDAFRRDPLLKEPEAFDRAETRIFEKLESHNLIVTKTKDKDFERGYDVRDPATNKETKLDLGRDRLPGAFIGIPGYGKVVNRDDMAGMKMRALYERHAERDYVDYDAMRRSGAWSADDLVELLECTGSIDSPPNGDWRTGLIEVLTEAEKLTSRKLLRGVGVADADALFKRLHEYALEYTNPKPVVIKPHDSAPDSDPPPAPSEFQITK